ncbi:hypothetical protein M0802_012398 [Mischocyttarus mexicanus]|nr:hypothetical protein M0802_012398 [Mischocyttarus mexicanus]
MELIQNLKIRRASLRRCMTRLEKLITEGSLASAEINARSHRLKTLMSRYEDLHETLDEHEKDHGEFNDLDELHDTYYAIIAKLSENHDTNTSASTLSTTSCATPIETPRLVSLPRINIPKFDRNFEKWIPYRDGFMTLVGSRTDMNELEKLDYLRESLIGLPRETVSQFSVKEGSYKLAWDALLAAYDRKRLLLSQHVDALLATQKPKITDLKVEVLDQRESKNVDPERVDSDAKDKKIIEKKVRLAGLPGRPTIVRTGKPGRPRKERRTVEVTSDAESELEDDDEDDNDVFYETNFGDIDCFLALNGENQDEWNEAIYSEFKQIVKNDTWDIIVKPDTAPTFALNSMFA